MTALGVLRLVPEPGQITNGHIWFGRPGHEVDVVTMSDEQVREFRGSDVAMIFQDPMTSMNPVLRVGLQIEEAMRAHRRFSRKEARQRVIAMLTKVQMPAPERRARDYPHQFSGGMRQRAMIAMGLSNEPSLIVADEPTTALDVTVQAQVIKLLRDLNRELGTAIILITHNLAVVASLCTRVVVLYAGRIVEEGLTKEVFKHPQHPYTWSLLRSIPRVDSQRHDRLISIRGMPPDMSNLPSGCKFHPRCPLRIDQCSRDEPGLIEVRPGQRSRCWVQMMNADLDKQVAAK